MTTTEPLPIHERVPLNIKLSYGLGAVAYGIKDNGFATFLLLFYNQVVGLPAATVGLVIAVALVFDAFIDPLLGVLSDRTRTLWGRRHPWLYASALPIAISWILLWHPPAGTQAELLGWLFVTAILTRAAIATNEVPSLALAPELTRDYHERTVVLRYRYLFGWIGGLGFLMLAYGWFLAPPRGAQSGPLAMTGYGNYGTAAAIGMALAVLLSALGTHRFVVSRAPPPVPRQNLAQTLAAVRETLSNRAFLILMMSGILIYTAQGVSFSLSNYLLGFVWLLTPGQFLLYSLALFTGVVLAFLIVAPVGRLLGKPRAAFVLSAGTATLVTAPYVLHLAGLFPTPGTPGLVPVFLAFSTASTAISVATFITGASMMSDVVEAAEEETGRREEGLFFAGALFMQKCSSGIGILLTGTILGLAQFPDAALKGQVPTAVLDHLVLLFCVAYFSLALLSGIVVLRFPFGQAEHDARLAKLAVAASENA
jgi:GPH family glycoside/pentoside/hexuronide:cation symporter